MSFDLDSQLKYADEIGLRAFLLSHSFEHRRVEAAISARFGQTVGGTPLTGTRLEDTWISLMRGAAPSTRVLQDWLQLHANQHQAEYNATGIGLLPDLVEVDLAKPDQFYDWMDTHRQVHANIAAALGLN